MSLLAQALAAHAPAEVEQRFRTMADCAPVLLWMSERDGLCSFFNQPWLDFTGRAMEIEVGNGWAEGVHPEDFQQCMTKYLDAFVARRPFRMEYRLRRADGQYRWVLDTGVPRYGPDGAFQGYIGSCIDVTELKRAHDELDAKVRDRTKELEAFAYSVSHDLRAPLRAISGFGAELQAQHADRLDDHGRDCLHRMCRGAAHMGVLIDGLLALSRITCADLERTPVDISAMARAILDELHEREPSRAVETRIADGLTAQAEPRLVRLLLENLLGNAWKFTAARPVAHLEVGREPKQAAFFVRDDGAGFDMAYYGQLFAPFRRLHPSSQFEGTGIGLAIVHRVAARHAGRVWAEGAVGRGATFYFTLEGVSSV